MQRKILSLMTVLLMGFLQPTMAAETGMDSPVGYWKILDDVSGMPKYIVQISQSKDNFFSGKIIKFFSKPGQMHAKLCTACQGSNHNKTLVGMTVMSGLKEAKTQWNGGHITDLENGKTYSCNLRLTDHGKKLNMHVYTGLPLFGHSQTWERVDLSG